MNKTIHYMPSIFHLHVENETREEDNSNLTW